MAPNRRSPRSATLTDSRPLDAALAGRAATLAATFAGCVNAALRQEGERWEVVGDPTEGALLTLAGKLKPQAGQGAKVVEALGPDPTSAAAPAPDANRLKEHPCDADRKRMTVIRAFPDGSSRALVKGAPDMLLTRCTQLRDASGVRPLTEADRAAIGAANDEMASRALRVLAAATRELPQALVTSDDADAVERGLIFEGLVGLQDPPRPEAKVAVARCQAAGIRVVMITGDHPATALAIARELGLMAVGSAPVAPDHGQAQVAVAPAFVMTGVELDSATDQALDFASIVAAVEVGRGVYANIRKTLQYLVTDGLPALALATDPLDPAAMNSPPRDPRAELTDRDFLATLAWTGGLTAAVVMATYVYVLSTGDTALARTSAFAVLVYAELLRSLGARSDTQTIVELPPHTNWKLLACVVLGVLFQPWGHHQAPAS